MNTSDKCKNCGGDRGIHHYQTDQCPVGGRECSINQKQEYKSTTFEVTESEVEELRKSVKDLLDRVEELEIKVDSLNESDLAETVRIWGAG